MQLRDWAFTGSYEFYQRKLEALAQSELPAETWGFPGEPAYEILKKYIRYTFEKLWAEREAEATEENKQKIIYMDEERACFNTGLFNKNWDPVYFYCVKNTIQPWKFIDFYNSYTVKYTGLPQSAVSELRRPDYFSDPSALIFDVRLKIVPQWNHILDDEDNYKRIPELIRNMGKAFCQKVIYGEIENVKKRIEANYKTAVPQWYKDKLQLLIPLYLTSSSKPDLALALSLSEDRSQYFGHTCLTTEMAYNNARLIAKPESYWLAP